jgi:hypothetical protein
MVGMILGEGGGGASRKKRLTNSFLGKMRFIL